MKNLFKAVFVISVFSLLTRVAGFLFKIYLAQAIGAEGLGIYQIAFSVFGVLETFVASGLPLVVSKFTSTFNAKNDYKSKFSCTTAALIIGLITAISLCIIVLVFKNLFGLLFTDKRCLNILQWLMEFSDNLQNEQVEYNAFSIDCEISTALGFTSLNDFSCSSNLLMVWVSFSIKSHLFITMREGFPCSCT